MDHICQNSPFNISSILPTYTPIPLESVDPGELYVKTLTGHRITVSVTSAFTIAHVKAAIEEKEDIPARDKISSKTLDPNGSTRTMTIP